MALAISPEKSLTFSADWSNQGFKNTETLKSSLKLKNLHLTKKMAIKLKINQTEGISVKPAHVLLEPQTEIEVYMKLSPSKFLNSSGRATKIKIYHCLFAGNMMSMENFEMFWLQAESFRQIHDKVLDVLISQSVTPIPKTVAFNDWGNKANDADINNNDANNNGDNIVPISSWGQPAEAHNNDVWNQPEPQGSQENNAWGQDQPVQDNNDWGQNQPVQDNIDWGQSQPAAQDDNWGQDQPIQNDDGWGQDNNAVQQPVTNDDNGWDQQAPTVANGGWGQDNPVQNQVPETIAADVWSQDNVIQNNPGWSADVPQAGQNQWNNAQVAPYAGDQPPLMNACQHACNDPQHAFTGNPFVDSFIILVGILVLGIIIGKGGF